MRFDLKEILLDADQRGYAVPAFNFSDGWELTAILEAARELRSPVIAASNMQVVTVHGAQLLGALYKHYSQTAKTPVIFHLDHSNAPKLCKQMLECGYPSVMFDGSALPLEENIRKSREVTSYAASFGACVEVEIGRIIGRNEESMYEGEDYLGTAEDALRLVQESNCGSLAVGLGNAHGFYREKPRLRFERLAEINELVDTPLVLHGGTGIPEEDIQKAIKNGINKVNVGTELHFTYLSTLQKQLSEDTFEPNVVKHMEHVVEKVKEPVKKWIRICMAENKA